HQLPQCDCRFHRQKYFDSPVATRLLLWAALRGVEPPDASTGYARVNAIGASMLLLTLDCFRWVGGCFHGASPAICWSQCRSTRPRHSECNSLSPHPGGARIPTL